MEWLSSVLLTIQVVSSLTLIVLVLLQQGKGADMGSSFGSGSAGSLFGASGAANFLSRTTKWAAIVFFASTAGLAYLTHRPDARQIGSEGVMQGFQSDAIPRALDVPQVPAETPAASSVSGNASLAVPSVVAPGTSTDVSGALEAPTPDAVQ